MLRGLGGVEGRRVSRLCKGLRGCACKGWVMGLIKGGIRVCIHFEKGVCGLIRRGVKVGIKRRLKGLEGKRQRVCWWRSKGLNGGGNGVGSLK